jgi:transcriptional/translational regulatory protein YebC/TACO1
MDQKTFHRKLAFKDVVEVISAELTRIPTNTTELDDESAQDVFKLIDKLEQDEDVQKVYHNMK